MFTSREWLADVQLCDYRNRLYDPDTGRFMQSDPLGFGAGDANLFRYCGNDPVNGSDPMGTETYFGFREIGRPYAIPETSITADGHQFVFTATNGNVTKTFGWGENRDPFHGVWTTGSTDDKAAAAVLLRDGGAVYQGDSSLDPFVSKAYDIVSKEPAHVNGVVDFGISNTCQAEARHLIDVARQLQADFLASRFLDYSDDGSPVYEAPAVSGFDARGDPIYGGGNSDGGGFIMPGSDFFGHGVFDIQNSRGFQGAGRDFWLVHTFKKH
jgi:RHS repeat-associated protein